MSPKTSSQRTRGTSSTTVDAYQLKVTLVGSKPPIWRRLQIAADDTLLGLHWAVQDVMGWDGSHLHEFRIDGARFVDPSYEDFGLERARDEGKYRLAKVLPETGKSFRYEYDFGDSWEHRIFVEKIIPGVTRAGLPVCLAGKNACPPEDSGGVSGYYNLLEAVADSDDPMHEQMVEWLGEHDPNLFDLDAVNRRLKK